MAVSPSRLTAIIKEQCFSLYDLHCIISDHGSSFNHIHVSAAFGMLWRIARSEREPPKDVNDVLSNLSDLALSRMDDLGAREVSNTLHSIAKLSKQGYGNSSPELIEALVSHASHQLQDFNPQNLSNAIWALATLNHPDDDFTSALILAARGKLRDFNPQNLSNAIWAMATLNHHDFDFTSALILAARGKLRDFNPQALSNTIWALATLYHPDDDFTSALILAARGKLRDFNPQALSNTIWALIILSHRNDDFSTALISELQGRELAVFTPKNLGQIFMFFMTAKDEGWDVVNGTLIPQDLWIRARDSWMLNLCANPSKSQLDVLKVVQSLPGCAEARGEVPTDDGFFNIDIALIRPDGTKFAIEVDGPQHFMSNNPLRMNGNTLLRNRMLEARGWQVISVPVFTWDKVPRQGKKQYLMDLLKAHGL